jgi:GH15 family glucan-1,4-alpha-glucosidase
MVALRDQDGYAPIREYAAIGDGRTVALVARDGSVDWLPLPDLDSPSIFASLLDAERGGRFTLAPEPPFEAVRRYLPNTNVLETTFTTDQGVVRVTDALLLPSERLGPSRELARRIEGVSGSVPMRWSVEPRFGYGTRRTVVALRDDVPIAEAGGDAVAVCHFDAGDHEVSEGTISGRFGTAQGSSSLVCLSFAHQEPLVFPGRADVEDRLGRTKAFWHEWADKGTYRGAFAEAVARSALALKLLVFAPSGAIAAAATTSLPEDIGGERNWDYRFSWVRDSAFTLDAFLSTGRRSEADAFFWWLMQASQIARPRLQVLYRLDGGSQASERSLPLEGYKRSKPVRVGNAAVDQRQLDIYGALFQTAWLYAEEGLHIDLDIARRLMSLADLVTEIWDHPDSGIWEVRSEPRHFTQSKMMCWVALDKAISLAEAGHIPDDHATTWRAHADAIRGFVETRCWSARHQSYVRSEGDEEPDASLLLGALFGYGDPRGERLQGTVDAVRRELVDGPLVRRYVGEDGLDGTEGAFLACSFWLVEVLARGGRKDEATRLMEELLDLRNDVGLYAEEVDPTSGAFLGNFPQALPHLSLISAAVALEEEIPPLEKGVSA